ncbi:MAG: FHA domain-containing protein [Bdellovibrionota bacterium]
MIRDLNSTNGTFVGNVRVKEVFLTASSVIRIGKTKIRFTPQDELIDIYPSKKSRFGDILGQSLEMRKFSGFWKNRP